MRSRFLAIAFGNEDARGQATLFPFVQRHPHGGEPHRAIRRADLLAGPERRPAIRMGCAPVTTS
jgi:hypothetical protein